jgi:hypothetical protein
MALPRMYRYPLLWFVRCDRAASPPPMDPRDCFLLGGHRMPPGNSDPAGALCEGWISVREAAGSGHETRGAERDILWDWDKSGTTDRDRGDSPSPDRAF